MRSKFLASCFAAAVAVGIAGFACGASASTLLGTYHYSTATLDEGLGGNLTTTVPSSHTDSNVGVGSIKLTHNGSFSGDYTAFNQYVFCLDLYNWLQQSNSGFNVYQNGPYAAGDVGTVTVPHAALGGADVNLSDFQVRQIGAVIANGYTTGGGSLMRLPFSSRFGASSTISLMVPN